MRTNSKLGYRPLRQRGAVMLAALLGAACGGRANYSAHHDATGGTGFEEIPANGGASERDPEIGGESNAGTSSGGASNGGRTSTGTAGEAGASGECRPGDLKCGSWRTCELEFSSLSDLEFKPKASCGNESGVSAMRLASDRLDGVNANFELIASPTPNIMIAGSSPSVASVSLFGLPPDTLRAVGSTFQATDATTAEAKFLRRGSGGRTFVIGTTDGNLFSQSNGTQDVFVVASSASDLQTLWTTQFGSEKSEWVHGAVALPSGGLAAVGTSGPPSNAASKRMLWLLDRSGALTSRELKFADAKAVAAGLDVDAMGNLYLVTTPDSTLLRLSGAGDVQSVVLTGQALECTDCQRLAVTPVGATYLLGTATAPNGKDELRLSRRGADGKLGWTVELREDLRVASLFTRSENVIVVGTLNEENGTAVLFELDRTGAPIRQLRFASNVSVLSASRADNGRIDVLLRSSSYPSESALVELAQ
ncbi:MAG TPA: hypothetical protein VER96_32130 [Polyangiaceae bacterium]|nr:hypothetical protein [Polyangiaceae bacterium]